LRAEARPTRVSKAHRFGGGSGQGPMSRPRYWAMASTKEGTAHFNTASCWEAFGGGCEPVLAAYQLQPSGDCSSYRSTALKIANCLVKVCLCPAQELDAGRHAIERHASLLPRFDAPSRLSSSS
jgi:hypothetical protein